MKAVHFGAGNIGRGFIGQVLHKNNFEIVFVDTNQEIIDQINRNQCYQIEYIDEHQSRFLIDRVKALNPLQYRLEIEDELSVTDIITTSVGVNNLKHIAPIIKNGLLKRAVEKSLNILANENAINATELLKEEIHKIYTEAEWQHIEQVAYFVNTAIDRLSLSKNENNEHIALVEPYFEWVINQSQLAANTPYFLSHVKLTHDLTPFIERKLFIVNAEHAAFAYAGALFGYETIYQAIQDSRINLLVRAFLKENLAYFIKQYAMDVEELDEFVEKTITRHGNSLLADPIERVGRAPIRKLKREDRLVAPILRLNDLGLTCNAGLKILAAAYLYDNPNDTESVELQAMISNVGITQTIRHISGVPIVMADRISMLYQEIKRDRDLIFK